MQALCQINSNDLKSRFYPHFLASCATFLPIWHTLCHIHAISQRLRRSSEFWLLEGEREREERGEKRGMRSEKREERCGAYAAPHPAAGLSPARCTSCRMCLLVLTGRVSGYAAVRSSEIGRSAPLKFRVQGSEEERNKEMREEIGHASCKYFLQSQSGSFAVRRSLATSHEKRAPRAY